MCFFFSTIYIFGVVYCLGSVIKDASMNILVHISGTYINTFMPRRDLLVIGIGFFVDVG